MLASITPLGERSRRSRWGVTFAWFVTGATAGGAAIGAVLGGVSELLNRGLSPSTEVRACTVAAVLAIAAAWDLQVIRWSLPTTRRQVNAYWIGHYRGWVVGLGFGFQLGLGIGTIASTALVYAILLAAVLAGSLVAGLAIGVAFGLARALALLPASRITTPARLFEMSSWVAEHESRASRCASTVALLCAGALIISSLSL